MGGRGSTGYNFDHLDASVRRAVTPPDSENPIDLLYSPEHQWLGVEGEVVRIGVTEYGQHELGDVVDAYLPALGTAVTLGGRLCEIESVKVAFELLSPLSGEVVAVNEALTVAPELINESPYGDGWLVQVKPRSSVAPGDFLDAAAYDELVRRLHGA